MTVRKLDESTQRELESQMCKENKPLIFKMLQEFHEQRIVMLESLPVLPKSTVKVVGHWSLRHLTDFDMKQWF